VTLDTAAKGSFTTLNGFTNAGSGVYTFSGTAAQAQAAIRGLVFTPTANRVNPAQTETTTFTVSVSDSIADAATNAATTVVSTSVNDAPTVGGATALTSINDTATATPFSAFTIADADTAQTQTVSITLDTAAKGSFTTLNGFTNAGSGVYTFSGTAAQAQAAIRALVFTPTANRVNPALTETTAFMVSVSDSIAAPATNATTTVVSTSVNDAPTVLTALQNLTTLQDQPFSFVVPANTFADIDTNDTQTFTATMANGSTLPSWLAFDPVSRTFRGIPANPDAGIIAVRVSVADSAGGTVSSSFDLTVTAVAPPIVPETATPLITPPDLPSNTAAVMLSPVDPLAAFTPPSAPENTGSPNTPLVELASGPSLIAPPVSPPLTEVRGSPTNSPDSFSQQVVTTNPVGAILTSAGTNAFQITVTRADQPALVTFQGVPDQRVIQSGEGISFNVPADAFAHTNARAVVQLSATQTDGQPLPSWLKFDAVSGKFSGQPPPGEPPVINVRLVASDAEGREAVAEFKIILGEDAGQRPAPQTGAPESGAVLDDFDSNGKRLVKAKVAPPGRASLSEQIRLANRQPAAFDRLVIPRRAA
ncbi:putative Ig domain-containing protein, partial [Propionivibrio sp.]|uniref:putative Ig domain-containing protein n=1 Tax=Propionivibrio sp. TaxID=2212460 RepID=UPI003BF33FC1